MYSELTKETEPPGTNPNYTPIDYAKDGLLVVANDKTEWVIENSNL